MKITLDLLKKYDKEDKNYNITNLSIKKYIDDHNPVYLNSIDNYKKHENPIINIGYLYDIDLCNGKATIELLDYWKDIIDFNNYNLGFITIMDIKSDNGIFINCHIKNAQVIPKDKIMEA